MAINKLLVLISHHYYFKNKYRSLRQSTESVPFETDRIEVGRYEQKIPDITFVFHNHWTEDNKGSSYLLANKNEIEPLFRKVNGDKVINIIRLDYIRNQFVVHKIN